MAINKNDKGLTLIELLITIAVIAIVAAISVPVITNVIADSRTNSASAMQEQAQAFIDKYEASGEWSFDTASQTFLGGIDEDGNGTVALGSVASPGAEVIDTLAVDAGQFTATVAGTTATVVAAGGSNNAGGNNNSTPSVTLNAGHFGWGSSHFVSNGTIRMMSSTTNTADPSTSSDGTDDAAAAIANLSVGDQLVYAGNFSGTFTITSMSIGWDSGSGTLMHQIGIDNASAQWFGTAPFTSSADSSVTVTFIYN